MSDLEKKETVFKLGVNTVSIEHEADGRAGKVLVYPTAGVGIGTRIPAQDVLSIAKVIREINEIILCRELATSVVGSMIQPSSDEKPEGGNEDGRERNEYSGREGDGCYRVGPGKESDGSDAAQGRPEASDEKESCEKAEGEPDDNDHG
jgi:hypothetical protein